ncbi:5374_t:CDS:2 [Paraglomus brasilianum]|uniref:5374_t:CDS:1 n=1 Tax=Paraglomus brasilianum TaxID=144538 RepID=A0A9N9BZI2_9GLOM|nr:5374_t:CDS:2 [Paraglomus brasilianum]
MTEQQDDDVVDNNSDNNSDNVFKFTPDALRPASTTPIAQQITPYLHFASQDLGKLFAQPSANVEIPSLTSQEQPSEQHSHSPLFRKIARPIPPSLNTNFTPVLNNNTNTSFAMNNNFIGMTYSPSDIPESSHRRRDSNVSAMSIQMYDTPGHQRRDSNVSAISMQLDTPTSLSENESGNEEDNIGFTMNSNNGNMYNISTNKTTFAFPFPFIQKPLSRPGTPTTAPSTPPKYPLASQVIRSNLSLSGMPQLMRRSSMSDLNVESSSSGGMFSDSRSEKPLPVQRPVRARRASLLPKTKSFTRVANELQEEARPIEAEIKQEYKTTKVLKNELEKVLDLNQRHPEELVANWLNLKDIQLSLPYSKLNPEVDMTYRQDTTSPTQTSIGPWPVSGRIKRKASDESHFNPKRRAVSPSHIGSPSTLSSPVANSPPSMAGSSGSAPSTPSHNIFMKDWLYKNFHNHNNGNNDGSSNSSNANVNAETSVNSSASTSASTSARVNMNAANANTNAKIEEDNENMESDSNNVDGNNVETNEDDGNRKNNVVNIHDTNRRFSTMSLNEE